MFVEEIRRAVQAAPRNDLSRLSGMLWKAYAGGAIGEGQAQELAEAIEARKAAPVPGRAATGRRCGSKPRSIGSLERRRRWCASGKLPPQLAARFTPAETAALSAIAAEVTKRGDCRLAIGHIATSANAPEASGTPSARPRPLGCLDRGKAAHGLPQRHEHHSYYRARMREWLRLARGQGGGCKTMQRTPTNSYFPAAARPSSALKGPADKAKSQNRGRLERLRPSYYAPN